jgi:lipoprotein-releasing system permease protein
MYLTFAWRYFKAKKSANAINIIAWVTVGAIALATACQVLVLSVFNGFEGLVKSLYGAFYTDLKVIPSNGKTFLLTASQISQLKNTPGIEGFSLIAEEKALLQNKEQEDQQTTVYLKGVDDNYKNVTGVAAKTLYGKFETGTVDAPELVVGYGIQNAANISVGGELNPPSTLNIILPKKGKVNVSDPMGSLSEGNVTATGVFSIQQEFDNKYAITNIGFVKQQMGFAADEYSACEIKLKANIDVTVPQQQVQHLLGNNYTVQTKFQQNQSLYSTMRMEKWFIYAVFTLILVVSAFTMISALTMLVLEKQKDISILQSMGASKSMILKIFLSEGLLLGAIGAASGILLALMICLLQVKFHLLKLQGGSFLIDYFPVKLDISDFIMVASTAAAIAFIASWLPASKASRQDIGLR